jgi:hypothetical protein
LRNVQPIEQPLDAPQTAAIARLRTLVASPADYPAGRFGGRGIVICAGGARMLTCAWVAISVLRRVLGCALPIELWHLGPRELGPTEAALFATLDVEIVDALERASARPARTLGGWELKPFALAETRFEEVLMLDADNVAVTDPSALFDTDQFAATGMLVWPDLVALSRENPIWELCGVPYRSEPAWESGQIVIDKSRCWPALQVALCMNESSDLFYPLTHGDKDTFHLAWILAGAAWSMPSHPARATTTGIFQRGFDGALLFQHRSTEKWRLTGGNVRADEFRHEDACLSFLRELRDRWSGSIDSLPVASVSDARAQDALLRVGWHRLRRPGQSDRLIELLAGNRIGVGAARRDMLRWYVRDAALVIDGVEEAAARLTTLRGARWSDGTSELLPAPGAGEDARGLIAIEVLGRLAEDGALCEEDVVTTLATLAQLGDLEDAFDRARSRWPHTPAVLRAIDRARRRVGLREPSSKVGAPVGYVRLR